MRKRGDRWSGPWRMRSGARCLPRGAWRYTRWAVLAIGLLGLLTITLAGCASPYASQLTDRSNLNAVALVSASDGWAVGDAGALVQFHAGRWTYVAGPTGADLNGVALVAPGEGWAVGLDVARGVGVLLHLHNGRWALAPGPEVPALRGVALVAADDGWAVGDGGALLHWDGRVWSLQPSPTTATLTDVDLVAPGLGWAVGYTSVNTDIGMVHSAVILRLTGSQWTLDQTYPNAQLFSVSMVPSPNGWTGWAVGEVETHPRNTSFQYVTGHWSEHDGPRRNVLQSVAALSQDTGWAVGQGGEILEYLGGLWLSIHSPTGLVLLDIALVSPNEGWAVGEADTILHFHDGTWTRYPA